MSTLVSFDSWGSYVNPPASFRSLLSVLLPLLRKKFAKLATQFASRLDRYAAAPERKQRQQQQLRGAPRAIAVAIVIAASQT